MRQEVYKKVVANATLYLNIYNKALASVGNVISPIDEIAPEIVYQRFRPYIMQKCLDL
jgi:hypothetical protein